MKLKSAKFILLNSLSKSLVFTTQKNNCLIKNNKASGFYELTAQLIKHGGVTLISSIYRFICNIWKNEMILRE